MNCGLLALEIDEILTDFAVWKYKVGGFFLLVVFAFADYSRYKVTPFFIPSKNHQ